MWSLQKFLVVRKVCMAQSVRLADQYLDGVYIFLKIRSSTDDRAHPCQEHLVITPETNAAVDSLVRNNRRTTPHVIADEMFMRKISVHSIMHERFQFRKICAQWVLEHLTQDQKS